MAVNLSPKKTLTLILGLSDNVILLFDIIWRKLLENYFDTKIATSFLSLRPKTPFDQIQNWNFSVSPQSY